MVPYVSKKYFDQKGTFWSFLLFWGISMLFVCDSEGPTTTKSEQIEDMGVGVDHKKFGEKLDPLVRVWCR